MSAFDTHCKSDALTSNMCEQFNEELLKVRGKPILMFLEEVREYITKKKIRCQTLLAKYNEFLSPEVQVPQISTFTEASFFQPMTTPPIRPPHSLITAYTMEATSSGTAARFAASPISIFSLSLSIFDPLFAIYSNHSLPTVSDKEQAAKEAAAAVASEACAANIKGTPEELQAAQELSAATVGSLAKAKKDKQQK
ncbi:hypothetical protein CRG98_010606 [Punica granatum]|uniref:Uncharacterized protein n=1 Tax=Punica granatum TaxID=22663 RepID=A0A2I0KKD5_PUNGR|nr:hypothetical protein CRG98_010606 [Punica granatum]